MQQSAGALSVSFHLRARLQGNAMLTLEDRRAMSHYCVAGQLQQTSQTNAQYIIQNILYYAMHFFTAAVFITDERIYF